MPFKITVLYFTRPPVGGRFCLVTRVRHRIEVECGKIRFRPGNFLRKLFLALGHLLFRQVGLELGGNQFPQLPRFLYLKRSKLVARHERLLLPFRRGKQVVDVAFKLAGIRQILQLRGRELKGGPRGVIHPLGKRARQKA